MTPELRAALRLVIEAYPAGGSVVLLREHALELLDASPVDLPLSPSALPAPDLDVADLARRTKRHTSTIRGWLEAGRIPGAYRDASGRWRIPAGALLAFEAAQREGRREASPAGSGRPLRLDSWRTAS